MANEARRIAAIEAARARRSASAADRSRETQWFIDEVSNYVALHMRKRVRLATELVKSRVIKNISRPVTKTVVTRRTATGQTRSYTRVTNRSKPGEFPKADTTLLMKTIFSDYQQAADGVYDGMVGTPLSYGLILETSQRLDRSFLRRTLNESRTEITRILTGPLA